MNILVLDVGTTSMRCILFDETGSELAQASVLTQPIADPARGTMEQEPAVYLKAASEICREIAQGHSIDAISVTAFRSAPALVDRSGNALCNFIMWQDTRNAKICRSLKRYDAQVYQTCGAAINTVFAATKLTWMKENMPEIYRTAYKAMIVPDFILHFMTGLFRTDHTYGSRTLLMDIKSRAWSPEMIRLFDVDADKLCELCSPGSIYGTVRREFAALTGIAEGVPVVTAGGDQQCGALGMGVTDERTIGVNCGTGAFIVSATDEPMLENPAVICNAAAIPGKYIEEMNVLACASALDWLLREFFPEFERDGPDYAAVNRIAENTPPGSNGLLAIPHFQGCGSRSWNPGASAGFWGFSLGSRREDMIRALYEGIAAEIAKSIEMLPQPCSKAEEIAISGGMSNSDVFLQILSDMTGKNLLHGYGAQATARGAFISAAVALGMYESYDEAERRCSGGKQKEIHPQSDVAAFYRSYYRQRTERLYMAACGHE